MLTIRPAEERDRDAIWAIFQPIAIEGETYPHDPNISREDALAYWYQPTARTFVAENDSRIVGAYLIRPNQVSLGSHVAHGAYMVSADARGLGVGRALGEHSTAEARWLGYRAMQFNLVVATNEPSVRLWKSLGFQIVGTLPGAFRHRSLGFVDAYVMFKSLLD